MHTCEEVHGGGAWRHECVAIHHRGVHGRSGSVAVYKLGAWQGACMRAGEGRGHPDVMHWYHAGAHELVAYECTRLLPLSTL